MNTRINPAYLRALLKIAPSNDVRYYLNGVYLDSDKGVIVATDGHRLGHAPLDILEGALSESVILSTPKTAPPKGCDVVELSLDDQQVTATWSYYKKGNLISQQLTTGIDGKYPEWGRVVADPCTRTATEEIGINTKYLADVQQAIGVFGCKLAFKGSDGTIAVSFGDAHKDFSYSVMPMRI